MASTRSKASKAFACWTNRNWLRENLYDVVRIHEELLDGVEEEAEQFDRPCPNLATEDTYSDGGEDDVRGRREDGVGEVAAAKHFVAGVVES